MLRNQSEKDIALSNRPAKYDEMIKIEQAEAGTKNVGSCQTGRKRGKS